MPGRKAPQLYIRLRSRTDGQWRAPPTLKARMVADATEKGSSVNAVAAAILAPHYGITLDSKRRVPRVPSRSEYEMNLKLPEQLDTAIRVAAARVRPVRSPQQEALRVLCAHYGLPLVAPPVRTRRPRRALPATA